MFCYVLSYSVRGRHLPFVGVTCPSWASPALRGCHLPFVGVTCPSWASPALRGRHLPFVGITCPSWASPALCGPHLPFVGSTCPLWASRLPVDDVRQRGGGLTCWPVSARQAAACGPSAVGGHRGRACTRESKQMIHSLCFLCILRTWEGGLWLPTHRFRAGRAMVLAK
eukprot:gene23999-biopygen2875